MSWRGLVSLSNCSVLRMVEFAGTNDASRFGSKETLNSYRNLIVETFPVESRVSECHYHFAAYIREWTVVLRL